MTILHHLKVNSIYFNPSFNYQGKWIASLFYDYEISSDYEKEFNSYVKILFFILNDSESDVGLAG